MKIKELRIRSGMTQQGLCNRYGIPMRTLQHWEKGDRECPEYVENLLERAIEADKEKDDVIYKVVDLLCDRIGESDREYSEQEIGCMANDYIATIYTGKDANELASEATRQYMNM